MQDAEAKQGRVLRRVLYADTDAGGVVYHGSYFRFFEVGRVELLRAHGLSYREVEGRGFLFPVAELHFRYRLPARYDDLLEIQTRIGKLRHAGLRFDYELRQAKDGTLLTEGFTRHACLDAKAQKVVAFPPDLKTLLREAQEATTPPPLPGA